MFKIQPKFLRATFATKKIGIKIKLLKLQGKLKEYIHEDALYS